MSKRVVGGVWGGLAGAAALACGVALAASAAGCGDSGETTGATSGDPSGGGCAAGEGCPSIVSDCLAFADNTGKDVFALRLSQLRLTQPAGLADDPTVRGLLDRGISLDYPSCNTEAGDAIFVGDGTFSWILEFDKATGILRTGGAIPEADPAAGYCFVNETIQGFDVAPLEVEAPITSGTFATTARRDVVVPIYTSITDTSNVILLPLRAVSIFDGTLSDDQNCAGAYNADGLDPNNLCLPDATTNQFLEGGALDGYILLEDADDVLIPELGDSSLCTLLAGPENSTEGLCNRDGGGAIAFRGDWCAGTTETDPGTPATDSCADSVKLAATFAASGTTLKASCP